MKRTNRQSENTCKVESRRPTDEGCSAVPKTELEEDLLVNTESKGREEDESKAIMKAKDLPKNRKVKRL